MGFLVDKKGGYRNVGFSKKDLYNYIDKVKRGKIKDGDVVAGLSYLQGKADNNPICADFQFFGDVLAFDVTYKKNRYKYPLVIFSGKNHHSQTVIFGCEPIADETIDTYKWVLRMFSEAMFNKHPAAMVTDGDGAMRKAIMAVFPNVCHGLCGWHLNKNACENVKNSNFLDDFKKAMYSNFTPNQFEEFWEEMVSKHGLQGNRWVMKTYGIKEMWASAYLRDKFFARIRTTSQCEGINSLIKAYVRSKNTIVEFIHNFEHALREYRYKELCSDFNSLYFELVLTTSLQKIERQASKVFTLDIFKDVKYEIERAGGLNVIERSLEGDNVVFKLNEYCKPRSERFVVYDKENTKFVCDCRLFESCGIPCRHIFYAMRLEHIDAIPSCMICKRWRKDVKSDLMISDGLDEVEPDMMGVCRFVVASSHCSNLCDMVSQKHGHFKEFINDIMKLKQKYERLCSTSSTTNVEVNVVQDPTVVKRKGAPMKTRKRRKSKRCSNCKISGHVITTCPRLFPPEDDEVNINDEDYGPESQSLKRDVVQNHGGISSDENFPDSSSNHVSGSISHSQSMVNRPSIDKRNFRKKKMKSLSQISYMEVKPSPTECKANEVLNGPIELGEILQVHHPQQSRKFKEGFL
ncbi:Zinc finger, PMZ-type [Sesbania bispinosa]|nr:Zinc finger, PMZ-type [Sesbania bispinosa]